MVEQVPVKDEAVGSSPTLGAKGIPTNNQNDL